MKAIVQSGLLALVSGTVAALTSAAALAVLARTQGKGALQPTNATSHWLHGDRAAHVKHGDAAHTAVGFATHHASAVFWAVPFERWLASRPPRTPVAMLRDASAMAAVAAIVDYGVVPRRVTPGWELVLPKRSVTAGYVALALGLAAGALVTQELRRRETSR
jgi:hypothetical protein